MFRNRNTNRQFNSPPACANIFALRKHLRAKLDAEIRDTYNRLAALKKMLQYGWGKRRAFNYHNYVTYADNYRKIDKQLVALLRKRRETFKH